jgi:hypothetical protein
MVVMCLMIAAMAPVVSTLDPGQYAPQYVQRRDLARRVQELHPGKPLLAFLGSSRVVLAFAPEQLPPLILSDGQQIIPINFAHTSAGPLMNVVLLKRMIGDGLCPDYLIVELMPLFMGQDQVRQLARDTGLPDLITVIGQSGKPLEFILELAQQHARRGPRTLAIAMRNWLGDELGPGFQPEEYPLRWLGGLDKDEDTPGERAQAALGVAAPVPTMPRWVCFQTTPEAMGALKQLITLCQEHKITLKFLITPERSSLRNWYPPGADDELNSLTDMIAERYGVETIDARHWLDDTEFYDDHHSTRDGAASFTEQLHREVLEPWLTLET